jgi:deazaflavin-dependent oxidoreductase (nitroreductase family)
MKQAGFRMFMRLWSALYRATNGRLLGKIAGGKVPLLLLTTTGRKSGKKRTTPLGYMQDDGSYVVVASFNGAPKHPAWYLNLGTKPEVELRVKDRQLRARAETADPEEKARLWPRLLEMYPSYADYQAKTSREIPVVVLHPHD